MFFPIYISLSIRQYPCLNFLRKQSKIELNNVLKRKKQARVRIFEAESTCCRMLKTISNKLLVPNYFKKLSFVRFLARDSS
jgi:hypothetical protein